GKCLSVSIGGGRSRIDHALHLRLPRCDQKIQRAIYVAVVRAEGVGDGSGNRRYRRLMQNAIHTCASVAQCRFVQQIPLTQVNLGQQPLEILALSRREVVKGADSVTALKQSPNQGRADKSACTRYQIEGHKFILANDNRFSVAAPKALRESDSRQRTR